MHRRSLALLLPALLAASAMAQEKSALRILSFSGQLKIKTPLGIASIAPGGAVPEIASGSEIIVVSGEAVMQSGRAVVRADKGDSFSFNAAGGEFIEIKATGAKTSLSVRAGKALAVIASGSSVAVGETRDGKPQLTVTNGAASVSLAGGPPQSLKAGQTLDQTEAQTQAPKAPDTDAAPEPSPPPSYNPLQQIATVSSSAP